MRKFVMVTENFTAHLEWGMILPVVISVEGEFYTLISSMEQKDHYYYERTAIMKVMKSAIKANNPA